MKKYFKDLASGFHLVGIMFSMLAFMLAIYFWLLNYFNAIQIAIAALVYLFISVITENGIKIVIEKRNDQR